MANKMIVAIVSDQDRAPVSDALVREGFRATRLSSSGSFLRAGNSTLILGVKEPDVPKVLGILEEKCKSRQERVPDLWQAELGVGPEPQPHGPLSVTVGGATVFVLDVEQFKKL